jgi:hypothetical protein
VSEEGHIYSQINRNIDRIITSFRQHELRYLGIYNHLLTQLPVVDVAKNEEYQREYKAFWTMRGIGKRYCAAYFQYLQQHKKGGPIDPVEVYRYLLDFPTRQAESGAEGQTIQFSSATKLAHMATPSLPLYDKQVRALYLLPETGETPSQKLDCCRRNYDFVKKEHKRIVRCGLLGRSIRNFRNAFPEAEEHTDAKVIDWLIWKFFALATSERWFRQGRCAHSWCDPVQKTSRGRGTEIPQRHKEERRSLTLWTIE